MIYLGWSSGFNSGKNLFWGLVLGPEEVNELDTGQFGSIYEILHLVDIGTSYVTPRRKQRPGEADRGSLCRGDMYRAGSEKTQSRFKVCGHQSRVGERSLLMGLSVSRAVNPEHKPPGVTDRVFCVFNLLCLT